MKTIFLATALGIGLLASAGVYAADAPAGATAECKDGTYYSGASHQGACKGHKGVQTWLDKSAATPATPAAPAASTASASKPAPATKTATPASADSGGTPIATCNDGTTFSGTSHRGACRGHKGVATWLDTPAAATPAKTTAATPAPAPAATPAAPAKPATTETTSKTPTPASQIQQKAGGGPGLVWVNSSSKVYHCQNDQWYGKTKEGSYMSEAAAKAAGNRAAAGKECGG